MYKILFSPLSQRRLILSKVRAKKPKSQSLCPLCPGREEETPPELMRIEKGKGWLIRVIGNKYPIFEGHELVVETPEHHLKFEEIGHYVEVLKVFKKRYEELLRSYPFVCIFKNEGKLSGASLEHPHSQILPTPYIPTRIKREEEVFEGILRETSFLKEGNFLVGRSPFPVYPGEFWIAPSKKRSFLEEENLEELFNLLREAVRRLRKEFGDGLSFNVLYHLHDGRRCRYYVRLVPRSVIFGGFELISEDLVIPEFPSLS